MPANCEYQPANCECQQTLNANNAGKLWMPTHYEYQHL